MLINQNNEDDNTNAAGHHRPHGLKSIEIEKISKHNYSGTLEPPMSQS